MQYNILEARNQLSSLVKSARAGEEVIIANRGEPAVRLVAILPSRESSQHLQISPATWLDQNPLPKHLFKTHEEIEAGILQERGSWD